MRFKVSVEKQHTTTGVIEVEAADADAAIPKVEEMMVNQQNPLQTTSGEILWDEPEYDDGSFTTTGDVDEADEEAASDPLVEGTQIWNREQTEFGVSEGFGGTYRGEAGTSDRVTIRWPNGKLTKPCVTGLKCENGKWRIV
jgi:hypothetical protein